jgi:hypothetical protein
MYTLWDYPHNIFESEYGILTYSEWLIREKRRIESRGGLLLLWKKRGGMICSTYGHEITLGC